jgi:hypothetical protein
MKQILTREQVAKAISDLSGKGNKRPTVASIHSALGGRGSLTTLIKLKNELEAEAAAVQDSAEALKAFREIWAMARQEERQCQQVLLAEAKESLQTVLVENDRLEGIAARATELAANHEKAKADAEAALNKARIELENELSQAKQAQIKSGEQARQALEQLAAERAERTAEVSALRSELAQAVARGHTAELDLVRTSLRLEQFQVSRSGGLA